MPYTQPTLSELIKQAQADFNDITPQTKFTQAVSNAVAAQAYGIYGYVEYLSRQIFPHLADEQHLIEHCNFYGVFRKQASSANGYLTLTLSGLASIDTGTQWQSASGVIVQSTDSVISSASSVLVPVIATATGASSNCNTGEVFNLISPVSGVETKAVAATDGLTGGADIESLESLLARLLYRVQYPPSGGTKYDYVRWALECAGVTRAWCIPAPVNSGYVTVLFTLDEQASITPTSLDTERVAKHIDGHINEVTNQWEGKPAGAEIIVKSPVLKAINPTIKIYPDKSELRTSVTAALTALLFNVSVGETVYLSQLRATISNINGIVDCAITNLTSDFDVAYDGLATLGEITWQ